MRGLFRALAPKATLLAVPVLLLAATPLADDSDCVAVRPNENVELTTLDGQNIATSAEQPLKIHRPQGSPGVPVGTTTCGDGRHVNVTVDMIDDASHAHSGSAASAGKTAAHAADAWSELSVDEIMDPSMAHTTAVRKADTQAEALPSCPGPRGDADAVALLAGHLDGSAKTPATGTASRAPAGGNLPADGNLVEAAATATNIGDQARGIEIVQAATAARQATVAAAGADQQTLTNQFQSIPLTDLGASFQRASQTMQQQAEQLDSATGGTLEPSERARFRNLLFNAADKASFGAQAVQDEKAQQKALDDNSPFGSLFAQNGAPGATASPATKLLAEMLGVTSSGHPTPATTNDALVNRLVLFNGLPADQAAATFGKLRLAENARIKLPDGSEKTVPILHNGYILGASATGMDCSSFVSSLLPADVRKGRFTTLDFQVMWTYRRSGTFPHPPVYTETRARDVRATADAFTPLNFYTGDEPAVGDLIVFRLANEPIGHVFIVQGYHPTTMTADVLEASQSAGTIRSRELPMSVSPLNAPVRKIRLGLFGLRLRPTSTKVCSYADHVRAPAGLPRPASSSGANGGGGAL